MPLSLNNYTAVLPKTLLTQAGKCTVRECDETDKGVFVAYVDEGAETFDVSLTLSSGKEITGHECDCKSTAAFCRHKAALLLELANGKKTKPATKRLKTKRSKAEDLLDEAGAAELKAWLRELLLQNKDLELAFVQRFSTRKTAYTPEEARQLTADAVKAVVKARLRVETSELKKIVDLWTGLHAPVADYYLTNLTDEKAFAALHAVLESCLAFGSKINTGSNKIEKYIEGLLHRTVESIAVLYDDAVFYTATGYFKKYIPDGLKAIRMHYLLHLKNIIALSNDARRTVLIDALAAQYGGAFPDHLYNGALYTKALFDLVQQYGLLDQYYTLFKPIRFDNAFNQTLIEGLIEKGHLEPAEKYCRAQIAENFKDVYNVGYLELLKKIYRQQNNEKALTSIMADLLPFTFDFDDYLFLSARMEEGEAKKKWRTKIITKARNNHYNQAAKSFYFRLLHHEEAYKKMIESINAYTPYTIILSYFDLMFHTDKAKLLKAIIDKGEEYGWGLPADDREKDEAVFPTLADVMVKNYTATYLQEAIRRAEKDRYYFRRSRFLEYLKKVV